MAVSSIDEQVLARAPPATLQAGNTCAPHCHALGVVGAGTRDLKSSNFFGSSRIHMQLNGDAVTAVAHGEAFRLPV
jgi:hypothetical protein